MKSFVFRGTDERWEKDRVLNLAWDTAEPLTTAVNLIASSIDTLNEYLFHLLGHESKTVEIIKVTKKISLII